MSFVGKIMWYITNVGPDMEIKARQLTIHMSHHGPEHWKSLGCLIEYLKGKQKKGNTVRNTKVLNALCSVNPTMLKTKKLERVLEVQVLNLE